jgi:hypothetical protein
LEKITGLTRGLLRTNSPEFNAPQAVELKCGTPGVPTSSKSPSRGGRVKGEDPGESRASLDAPEHSGTPLPSAMKAAAAS